MGGSEPIYLTHPEAAERARMSKTTLFEFIKRGEGPKRIRIGGSVLYRVEDIDQWLAEHEENGQGEAKPPKSAAKAAKPAAKAVKPVKKTTGTTRTARAP